MPISSGPCSGGGQRDRKKTNVSSKDRRRIRKSERRVIGDQRNEEEVSRNAA